jgi:hypothetical protein
MEVLKHFRGLKGNAEGNVGKEMAAGARFTENKGTVSMERAVVAESAGDSNDVKVRRNRCIL